MRRYNAEIALYTAGKIARATQPIKKQIVQWPINKTTFTRSVMSNSMADKNTEVKQFLFFVFIVV